MPKRTFVYRLDIVYPPASDAEDWAPEGWSFEAQDPDTGAWDPVPFGWPSERLFLSRSGAQHRADLLRGYGCTVTIHRSLPVEWEVTTDASS